MLNAIRNDIDGQEIIINICLKNMVKKRRNNMVTGKKKSWNVFIFFGLYLFASA